jgi:hypothetical protein
LLVFIRPKILRDADATESTSEEQYDQVRQQQKGLNNGHIMLLPGKQPVAPPMPPGSGKPAPPPPGANAQGATPNPPPPLLQSSPPPEPSSPQDTTPPTTVRPPDTAPQDQPPP